VGVRQLLLYVNTWRILKRSQTAQRSKRHMYGGCSHHVAAVGFSCAVLTLAEGVAARPVRTADFNGDGRDDLAIGVSGDHVDGFSGAGSVLIVSGHPNAGLDADDSRQFTQATPGLSDVPEMNDRFGEVLTWGDFDGDGFSDLAIGVPFEDIAGFVDAGAAHVLYGSPVGIIANNAQVWTQNSPGVQDQAEATDRFGFALAAGDFNNDGFDDLAIGVPFEDLDFIGDAGVVHVLYGSESGLSAAADQFWTQNSSLIQDQAEFGDRFGMTLASGDFTGDGRDDLAIAAPFEDVAGIADAGVVHVLKGGALKLIASGNQLWSQDSGGIPNDADDGDHFGLTLVAGDFNGDSADDLAIAAPDEDLGLMRTNAGLVHVLYSSLGRLRSAGTQVWSQATAGIPERAETGNRFGSSLAAGDMNNDGRDDLLIGVPRESVNSTPTAGLVHLVLGSGDGLTDDGQRIRTQNSSGVEDDVEFGDQFGQSLTVGDFDGDGFMDVAIGVPFENIGSITNAGAVNVIFGSAGGFDSSGDVFLTQDTFAVPGVAEFSDNFGGVRVHLPN
jgi:hypothetical protein